MCGITGIFSNQDSSQAKQEILAEMMQVIHHRGPDGEGLHLGTDVALGMRRLSIIDLETGDQPIYNEDRSIAIVFNGEIYNYKELLSELAARGHKLSSVSDTEAVVHLYEELGVACLEKLRGMFAFALWDSRKRRLFIARDRLGIKPLYYTVIEKSLIFGSEIKSILRHPLVSAEPDIESLSNFLSLKYIPAPQTAFKDISALPPGHFLLCDAENGVKIQEYWDIPYESGMTSDVTEEEYLEELESILNESVRLHLRSDVPFGAFLSGGVDSSTIVALMSKFLDAPVKTFSVGYTGDGSQFSELEYARMVARKYKTDHHEVVVSAKDFRENMEKVVWHLDQPIADQAAVPTYMVSELASQEVKMVLTGEGGDELFGGYARYSYERLSPFFNMIPASLKAFAVNATGKLPGLRRPKLALYALSHSDPVSRLANWFPLFNPHMKERLLTDDTKHRLNGSLLADAVIAKKLEKIQTDDVLNRMLYVDTKLWLPDDLLARGDKMTMAASIEGRVPILDHHMVEFAARVPPALKVKGWNGKYLLKKFSERLLPREVIYRKKAGFPMPVSVWFRGELKPFVHDILTPASITQRGLFEGDFVFSLLNQHERGLNDHSSLIWALLNVELWFQAFID